MAWTLPDPREHLFLAPAAGEVTFGRAGSVLLRRYGHPRSRIRVFLSSFLHLSEVSVSVGDRLAPGDLIGAIGATGRATGPHLD